MMVGNMDCGLSYISGASTPEAGLIPREADQQLRARANVHSTIRHSLNNMHPEAPPPEQGAQTRHLT